MLLCWRFPKTKQDKEQDGDSEILNELEELDYIDHLSEIKREEKP